MNDERPIEKLLRRYAKKRREDAGAPMELHPATRRLLQGEVARQFRTSNVEKVSPGGWLAAVKRRWIYATAAACALLLTGIWLAINSSNPTVGSLAQKGAAPAKAPASEPMDESIKDLDSLAAAPASAEASRRALNEASAPAELGIAVKQKAGEELKVASRLKANLATNAVGGIATISSGDLATTREPANTLAFTERYGLAAPAVDDKAPEAEARSQAQGFAPLAAAPPASVSADRASASDAHPSQPGFAGPLTTPAARKDFRPTTIMPPSATPGSAPAVGGAAGKDRVARGASVEGERLRVQVQSFANMPPRPKLEASARTAPTAPVLVNFQIEQSGNRLRVIDADGSTYLGEVVVPADRLEADAAKGAASLRKVSPKTEAAEADEAVPQNYFYRVAGTNRTLNQPVVFTWNFLAPTNRQRQAQSSAAPQKVNPPAPASTPQVPGLFNNSGIAGRAQINAGREIEIRAVPVNQ